MRRRGVLIALVVLAATACGDEADPFGTTRPDATSAPEAATTSAAVTTTIGPSTATAPTTTATTTTTVPAITAAPPPTAGDALAEFFAAAEQLDTDIRAAAAVFSDGFDPDLGTLEPGVAAVVNALDAVPLGGLIPGGLSLDLETALLAVFADLDGRVSALAGGVREIGYGEVDWALDCLGNGAPAAARFAADLARAGDLALLEPPPTVAADSPEAGILAVRLTAIHSMNWGCESCGGVEYDAPIPVDWSGRTVAGVEFEATFAPDGWQILIYAC